MRHPLARAALVLALLPAALPWHAPTVSAGPPIVVHEPFPAFLETFTLTGACTFPVQQVVTGNREAVTIRVDPDGTQHYQIRGTANVRVVNANTGKFVDLKLSIPVDATVRTDGSQQLITYGQTLFFIVFVPNGQTLPPIPNPTMQLGPGAWLTHGKAVIEFTAQGYITSYTTTGRTTDICAKVAG